MRRSRRRPGGARVQSAVLHSPPGHLCFAPTFVSALSHCLPRSSLCVQACAITPAVLTLTFRQPMHTLLLESADDGLDGPQFLLVLLDPVRSAGSRSEI